MDYVIPILILAAICAIAFFGYRVITSKSSDNTPGTSDGRPLGDTAEAHDEVSPHDLPLDNPGRHAAEEMSGNEDGTTRGMADGGGASGTERFSSDADTGDAEVGDAEAHGGAKS